MKNKKKITLFIAIILVCIFTAYGIYGINKAYALAEDDFVVGTNNLNDTQENSAKVGDVIELPEKGWKRYDNNHASVQYPDNVTQCVGSEYYYRYYNNTVTIVNGGTVEFKFLGSQIRIISYKSYTQGIININVDGVDYENIDLGSTDGTTKVLVFEKLNLDNSVHTVKISGVSDTFQLDAIDIDEDGQLISKDGIIQPQTITLNKTAIDLLTGNKDKITATVLPENAVNKKIVWSSSDETIATVDQEGNVTAIKTGQVDITAKVDGTDLSASCKVIVTEKEPEPQPTPGKAILSISLVDGKTKDYDLSMEEVNKFINWYETQGSNTYKFDKNISPYKAVKEYIVHDKITSFEVREYE